MFKPNSSFLVLYTNNVAQTRDFYQLIGAEIKEAQGDKVVVKIDNHEIHFILDSSEPFEEYKYIAKKSDYGNGVVFYTEVEKIEDIYNKLKISTGKTKSEIFNNKWGARELLFEDNNGFKFAVYEML